VLGLAGARPEIAVNELFHVGLAVAVCVFHEPEDRRLADEQPAIHAHDAAGHDQPSAKTVRLSIRPSPFVSSSMATVQVGVSSPTLSTSCM